MKTTTSTTVLQAFAPAVAVNRDGKIDMAGTAVELTKYADEGQRRVHMAANDALVAFRSGDAVTAVISTVAVPLLQVMALCDRALAKVARSAE